MAEYVMGIDPGKKGGIAILGEGHMLTYPITEDYFSIFHWIRDSNYCDKCFIEKVHAMPKQGVTATFSFGQIYGALQMAVAGADIPMEFVTPRTWQKALGIKPRDKKESKPQFKERLRIRAKQLFPRSEVWEENLGFQRAVCDAMLIAEYGRLVEQ